MKKLVYVVLVYSRAEIDEATMTGYIREIKGPIDPATVNLELRLAGNSGNFSVLLSGGLLRFAKYLANAARSRK